MTKYKILNEPKVSPFVRHWYCPVFIFIFFPGKKRKHKKIKNSTIYYAKPGSKKICDMGYKWLYGRTKDDSLLLKVILHFTGDCGMLYFHTFR